ncbi:zinc-binding metallopeptidase family protein [Agrococcus jejuensis]|uniref:zinc-binding metallopeptidase family protein n=1 Tax=Agrococcus jejuensis TaxID=399736 RepID=UPI0011A8EC44|nr:putative zinc-binding metallopeptidase [Agrococcus jejuensis]
MRRFHCDTCGNEVFFDSTSCLRCGTRLGYVLERDDVVVLGDGLARCANAELAGCTWLAEHEGALCASCVLTRTRPNDSDASGLRLLPVAERAKRHVLRDLAQAGVPIGVDAPLRFDMLSSVDDDVTIGHANGVITMDLAEGEDSHRERMRARLAEPYRTMLGHFRHESGHYVEWQLVESTPRIEEARTLFGDERDDYQASIDRHYEEGPPDGWRERYLSAYATMHPYEDFAECWAHVLHATDALETAVAFDLIPPLDPEAAFRDVLLDRWLPFATAMNVVQRSLGQGDAYPFTLPRDVVDKLAFAASVRR